MWKLLWTPEAFAELAALRAYDRALLYEEIGKQLTHEPNTITRNRKQISGLVPPWGASEPFWELRVGRYRVFYDLVEKPKQVHIRAVRFKPLGAKTEEIL